MRILYTTPAYKPAYRVGGPILSVSAAAEHLAARGHEVTVITTTCNNDEELDVDTEKFHDVDGVRVRYFRREEYLKRLFPNIPYVSGSLGFMYAPQMARELRTLVPSADVVHTQLPYNYTTLAGGRAATRYGTPLFYSVRGTMYPTVLEVRALKKKLYLAAVEKPLMRRAAAVICLNGEECASVRRLGIDAPTEVVPNGLDPSLYRQRAHADVLGIPDDVPVILFMARFHPQKGGELLVDAFCRFARQNHQAVLVMAGPDEAGLHNAWHAKLQQAGLGDRVHFPGMVSGEAKLDLLARADVFCLPSRSEGFAMSLLEACASATPLLMSPTCYLPEAVAARVGIEAERDADAMADALTRLFAARQQLVAMGKRGPEFVKASYTWDSIADTLTEIYQKHADNRKRHA